MRALATFFLSAVIVSWPVFAADIQMLPPTAPGTSSVCSGGAGQALAYTADTTTGHAGINCMPVTIDGGGSVTATGNVQGSKLIVSGAPPIDASGATLVYNLAQLRCARGQVIISAGNGGWYCGSAFGGLYELHYPDNGCRISNPETGTCSCPSGFYPFEYWDFVEQANSGYGFYWDNGYWGNTPTSLNGALGFVCLPN